MFVLQILSAHQDLLPSVRSRRYPPADVLFCCRLHIDRYKDSSTPGVEDKQGSKNCSGVYWGMSLVCDTRSNYE